MCDIYMHKCEKCEQEINMHLGDYNTNAEEIKVYCSSHIPEKSNRLNGILWQVDENLYINLYETFHYIKTYKIFIEALTENAKKNYKHNHPNEDCKMIEIFGKKVYYNKKKGKKDETSFVGD